MEKYKNTLKYHWIGGEYYQSWMLHYIIQVTSIFECIYRMTKYDTLSLV